MGAHAPVLLVPTSMDRIVAFYYKAIKYIANPNREYHFQQFMEGFSLGEPRGHTPLQNLLKIFGAQPSLIARFLNSFLKFISFAKDLTIVSPETVWYSAWYSIYLVCCLWYRHT